MSSEALTILFNGTPLSRVMKQRENHLRQDIDKYAADYLLGVDEQELCQALLAKYSLQVPILNDTEREAGPIEDRLERGFSGTVAVLHYTIIVPFAGDPELFDYQPSHFSLNPPRGEVKGHKLHLRFAIPLGSNNLKQVIDHELQSINEYLGWVKKDAVQFNDSLEGLIGDLVTQRRQRLKRGKSALKDLGIPIRRRENLPEPYTYPSKREAVTIKHPEVRIKEALPKLEPYVPLRDYERILNTIYFLSLGMERSPESFSKQHEEQLRDFILMNLNVHFEGQATGETFNKGGKTDILIRVDNNNVFIAECKFWAGKKELTEAIDQLFTYVTWRDTKTAILLFNRNKKFTAVLKQIGNTVTSHPYYVRKHSLHRDKLRNETTFSYVFHYPDDEDQEILLTVLCFNIGQKRSS